MKKGIHNPHPYGDEGKTLRHGEEGFYCGDCVMDYAVEKGLAIYGPIDNTDLIADMREAGY